MSFASAARVAVDALYVSFGEAGTYTRAGGSPVAVSVIRAREDHSIATFGVGVRSPGWTASLRQSEVPLRPQSDDALTIGAESFVIRDVEEDRERLSWRCTLNAA